MYKYKTCTNMYKYKTCTNIKHPVAYITRLIPKEIIGLIVLWEILF
jgi:hypothetical protein